MQHKQTLFNFKGMFNDLSPLNTTTEHAFKIKNMRFITDEPSSLLSLTNEKGNEKINLNKDILGVPVGQASVDNTIILFTTEEKESLYKDTIYKINLQDNKVTTLFSGNLNFSIEHPLEILLNYENEDNIKLYWVDGINPFRVINIKAAEENMSKWNNDSFNAVPTINFGENVTITKNYYGGTFSPGTIQYAFTYFNLYGQESNIFYISDLYYTSFADRGGSPEETVSNSFTLNIKNTDSNFDYIRVYSVHRTSLNATPSVKVVVDIKNNGNISYTDTNTTGYTIDPTTLLYLGGESIIANTLSQKDNTLFLGNFKIEKLHISNDIKDFFNNFSSDSKLVVTTDSPLELTKKSIYLPNDESYYSYENQLKYSSRQIKTFKYLETYRFGIQFQHKTGKWSEPIWIEDTRINVPINDTYYSDSETFPPVVYYHLENSEIIKKILSLGYIKARPVVVYPTEEERECICQGILCPTVYNASDRLDNFPFTQSSWFIRPNAPFDYITTNQYGEIEGEKIKDWRAFKNPNGEILDAETSRSEYSRAGVLNTLNGTFTTDKEITLPNGTNMPFAIKTNTIDRGSVLEFRHNEALPINTRRNAEIQCIDSNVGETNAYTNKDKESYKRNYKNLFYVDQSIITLHSPDIEFGNIADSLLSNSKLRIIGYVPLTAFISDISVTTDNSTQTYTDWNEVVDKKHPQTNAGNGLYYRKTGVLNTFTYPEGNSWSNYGDSYFGYRSLASTASWVDGLYRPIGLDDTDYDSRYNYRGMFVLYPWHKIGSLNDTPDSAENKSSVLKRKVMSNLKYSYKTQYFNNTDIWESYIKGDKNKTGISGAVLFNSNEDSIVKIPAPIGSNREDIVYKGNVDKILTSDYEYDLVATRIAKMREYLNLEKDYYKEYVPLANLIYETDQFFHGTLKSKQPIEMKYKSTSHIVMALNYTEGDYKNVILPTIMDGDSTASWEVNKIDPDYSTIGYPFWEQNKESKGVYQDVLTSDKLKGVFPEFGGIQHGFLWLGELYRDNVKNKFGGTTEEAFENNEWLPAGDAVSLCDEFGNQKTLVSIKWTEGDTYYQRYDHLKTYPFTQEDSNSIVEIVSFMCETRVNLDGRYDRNRGLQSNLNISPQNFNLLNKIYSQQDNIFVYRGLNTNKQILYNFPTTVTWTKTKTVGEVVDTWTNITLASTLDFDGSKGSINAIRKYNNNLIVFQDDALAELMYNSNAQIASTVGVPIEIANSGKVDGKRYFAEIGCTNKWSICTSPQGLYFVSKYNKDIYCYADKLYNLSSTLYFDTWVNNAYKGVNTWDPYNFNNIVSYYDANNSDILFITKEECLAYSEKLGKFSSFYSYENTPYFINVGDKVITAKYNNGICEIWEQNTGDYNSFFGNYKPFGITFISNGESSNDKIFNTLDLRAEVFNSEKDVFKEPFDTLNTWNSYQEGTSNLKDIKGFPSNIKKKFRIWRVNVPRDNSNGRDRMRNPWLYLELLKQTPNTDKTVLHNITVNYFE